MSQKIQARRLRIQGRVQGVGFRYFTYNEALNKEVKGWVRNLPDGDVEAHIEGRDEQLERLLSRLRQGPSFSVVERIEATEVAVEGCPDFSIKY